MTVAVSPEQRLLEVDCFVRDFLGHAIGRDLNDDAISRWCEGLLDLIHDKQGLSHSRMKYLHEDFVDAMVSSNKQLLKRRVFEEVVKPSQCNSDKGSSLPPNSSPTASELQENLQNEISTVLNKHKNPQEDEGALSDDDEFSRRFARDLYKYEVEEPKNNSTHESNKSSLDLLLAESISLNEASSSKTPAATNLEKLLAETDALLHPRPKKREQKVDCSKDQFPLVLADYCPPERKNIAEPQQVSTLFQQGNFRNSNKNINVQPLPDDSDEDEPENLTKFNTFDDDFDHEDNINCGGFYDAPDILEEFPGGSKGEAADIETLFNAISSMQRLEAEMLQQAWEKSKQVPAQPSPAASSESDGYLGDTTMLRASMGSSAASVLRGSREEPVIMEPTSNKEDNEEDNDTFLTKELDRISQELEDVTHEEKNLYNNAKMLRVLTASQRSLKSLQDFQEFKHSFQKKKKEEEKEAELSKKKDFQVEKSSEIEIRSTASSSTKSSSNKPKGAKKEKLLKTIYDPTEVLNGARIKMLSKSVEIPQVSFQSNNSYSETNNTIDIPQPKKMSNTSNNKGGKKGNRKRSMSTNSVSRSTPSTLLFGNNDSTILIPSPSTPVSVLSDLANKKRLLQKQDQTIADLKSKLHSKESSMREKIRQLRAAIMVELKK